MKEIKEFLIFKNEHKEKDNQPDYKMMLSFGEEEGLVEGAALWLREGKTGKKFFSGKMSEAYGDRPGFKIVMDDAKPKKDAEQDEFTF
jgi:uncharacterized protein (DUF736 family)